MTGVQTCALPISVLGNLTYLEVRNMEALDKEIQEPFTDEDIKTLDDLGI